MHMNTLVLLCQPHVLVKQLATPGWYDTLDLVCMCVRSSCRYCTHQQMYEVLQAIFALRRSPAAGAVPTSGPAGVPACSEPPPSAAAVLQGVGASRKPAAASTRYVKTFQKRRESTASALQPGATHFQLHMVVPPARWARPRAHLYLAGTRAQSHHLHHWFLRSIRSDAAVNRGLPWHCFKFAVMRFR